MADESNETLRAYMEKILALKSEREQQSLSDDDLQQIARESGMSDDDLAFVQQKLAEYMNRGVGFMRYRNWSGAINELEQAETLAPNNAVVLSALAWSYWNQWRESGGAKGDRDAAVRMARRCLMVDPMNDRALQIVSNLEATRVDPSGGAASSSLLPSSATPVPARQARLVVLVGAVVAMFGVAAAAFVAMRSSPSTRTPAAASPAAKAPSKREPSKPDNEPASEPPASDDAGAAVQVLAFGQEGIGAGMFTDARSLALDASGHVYVCEYSGGRTQVFDSNGTFITQWKMGGRIYVRGMAANRSGTIYAVFEGAIHRFDGMTGKDLGTVPYSGGRGFIDVATTADGGLVAAWDGWYRGGLLINPENKDAIVRIDANGHTRLAARKAVSKVTDNFETHVVVAEDGSGTVYALSSDSRVVLKFKPDGSFIDRIGTGGDKAHKLNYARSLAVDGKGRLYVGDNDVKIYSADGEYIDAIATHHSVDDLDVDDHGNVWVLNRTKVTKYRLKQW